MGAAPPHVASTHHHAIEWERKPFPHPVSAFPSTHPRGKERRGGRGSHRPLTLQCRGDERVAPCDLALLGYGLRRLGPGHVYGKNKGRARYKMVFIILVFFARNKKGCQNIKNHWITGRWTSLRRKSRKTKTAIND